MSANQESKRKEPGLTAEELAQEQGEVLPAREALSLIAVVPNGIEQIGLPIGDPPTEVPGPKDPLPADPA